MWHQRWWIHLFRRNDQMWNRSWKQLERFRLSRLWSSYLWSRWLYCLWHRQILWLNRRRCWSFLRRSYRNRWRKSHQHFWCCWFICLSWFKSYLWHQQRRNCCWMWNLWIWNDQRKQQQRSQLLRICLCLLCYPRMSNLLSWNLWHRHVHRFRILRMVWYQLRW